jgi:hypothetical protein
LARCKAKRNSAFAYSDNRVFSETTVSFPEKVEARCRRFSRALAQRGGSIEDQPFGAGIIVVDEIALALELQRLAVGIGGGCALDEAAA